jgi:hypothetical protein
VSKGIHTIYSIKETRVVVTKLPEETKRESSGRQQKF